MQWPQTSALNGTSKDVVEFQDRNTIGFSVKLLAFNGFKHFIE